MVPYNLYHEGKIRKLYEYDDDLLIMFTTDRVSAFDVVLPNTIPGKGSILTHISRFWMNLYKDVIPNHLVNREVDLSVFTEPGDAILVKQLYPLPIEAIVRGYIIGSGWKEYQKTNTVCGIKLPHGLALAEKLDAPIYTPSTKAAVGEHDENITFNQTVELVGKDLAEKIRDVSIKLFTYASQYAFERGILIADTKFEFGLDHGKNLYLIDEVLTPDSSRYWDLKKYKTGISPESYDKQIIRDYLETIYWDKKPPGPVLPQEIVEKTVQRYKELEAKLLS
jgi:phosphoribosylaminoimidazole-succinocarboxamide synthase